MKLPCLDIASIFDDLRAGALLLTPHQRGARLLHEAYGRCRADAGLPPVCPSPAIHPVDLWVRRSHEQLVEAGLQAPDALLEPQQELLLWQRVLRASPRAAEFINLADAAGQVREAATLMQHWELSPAALRRHAQEQAQPHEDLELFLDWLEAGAQLRHRLALSTLSTQLERCLEALREGRLALPATVIVFGFRNPPPLYRRLLELLEEKAQRFVVFEPPARTPRLHKHAAPDGGAELTAAAGWAAAILAEQPRARIGVICPDLPGQAALAARIFQGALEPQALFQPQPAAPRRFSLSGAGLDREALLATALALLDLHHGLWNTLDFCLLLRSPFLLAAEAEADARAALEYELRRRGELEQEPARLRALLLDAQKPWHCPQLGAALLAVEKGWRQARGKRRCGDWLVFLEGQLALLGWPGERPLTPREDTLLRHWEAALSAFQAADVLQTPLSWPQALDLLRDLLRQARLRGAEQAPVQLLTPVEAEGQVFTHAWFLGLSEQHWPPPPRANPFLPLPLLRRLGLPEADAAGQALLARDFLQALQAATAEELVLSHPLGDEDGALQPSALLSELPGDIEALPACAAPPGLHPLSAQLAPAALDNVAENEHLPWPGEDDVRIKGAGTFLLAAQAACPFQAFALFRLGARDLPAPTFGLPAAARGILLHRALELFWTQIRGQAALLALAEDATEALLTEVVDAALHETAQYYPRTMSGRFRELEGARLVSLLRRWLDQERQRGSFEVLNTEQRLTWRHSRLVLNFTIDRVENLGDGLGLVDYKSGAVSLPKWLDPRQDSPQLLLYLLAMEKEAPQEPVSSVLYAQVNIEAPRFRGIAAGPDSCPDQELAQHKLPEGSTWEDLKAFWESSLQALAEEFLAGRLTVAPKSPATCRTCHLDRLCRVHEYALSDDDAEEEA